MSKIKITAIFYQNNAIEIKRLVFVQPLRTLHLLLRFGLLTERQLNGSSRSFVDLCETDQYSLFEVSKVTKTITHSFNRLNGVIDAFNDTGRKPMGEVVQHVRFPII